MTVSEGELDSAAVDAREDEKCGLRDVDLQEFPECPSTL